jgi:HlyD family secretion protein
MVLLLVLAGCAKNAEPTGTLFVSGRIDGDTVDISSNVAGRIVEITVREGAPVEAGQLLAQITSPQDEAQLDQQKADVIAAERRLEEAAAAGPARVAVAEANVATNRANVAASQAELVRWQAELEQAQLDAKRYPPLVLSGAAAAQTADQHKTRVKTALASTDASGQQVKAAEASLQQAEASLQQAKAQLEQIATAKASLAAARAAQRKQEANVSDLMITSPIAGTVITRSAEPGRVVQPGQTILTVLDMHKLYLRGFIPEGEIGKVKVGQKAQVYLDSNPNEAVPAEVIRIDPEAMFTPENIYFQADRVKQVVGVKVLLQGAYGFAKPGMPADGRIQIGTP